MNVVCRAAAMAAGAESAGAESAGAEPAGAELLDCAETALGGGSGAATGGVVRLTGRVRAGGRELPFSMVRKTFRPLEQGRHAAAAQAPEHWAYWRREPLAYASGAVPNGPHLTAPRCFAVTDDAVYLADVTGPPETPAVAARRLGAWQAETAVPDVGWLGGHQLAQRITASSLDWSSVDAPGAVREIWERRAALLAALEDVPRVLCHGDFHLSHLFAGGGVTTVLDWGTLAAGPAGADLAHLTLSTGEDLLAAYLHGLDGAVKPDLADRGHRVTLALTGVGRVHWMRSRGIPVPPGYRNLIVAAADRL